MTNPSIKTSEYRDWLKDLKQRVRQAQVKAAVQVNTALLTFYWELGADIVERQKSAKWGSGFLTQLSADLMSEFPDMKGFSYRNIIYVRNWYLFYSEPLANSATSCCTIASQAVSQLPKSREIEKAEQPAPQLSGYSIWSQVVTKLVQIPWSHNLVIISKCKDVTEALYYVNKTIEHNWSRNVLTHQIESGLYQREGKAVTNFVETLPTPQSDLAQQLIKDPYCFDFLTLTQDFNERELEIALTDHRYSIMQVP